MELLDQIVIELRHQGQLIACGVRYPQIVQDQSEQLGEIEMGVKNKGRMDGGLHSAHESSEQGRFAGSCFARNDDKALAGLDTVTQGSECFPIKRIGIRKTRIGCDAKR